MVWPKPTSIAIHRSDHQRSADLGPNIASLFASNPINWIGGSEFPPPSRKIQSLPFSDAISLFKGFFAIFMGFCLFFQRN